MRGKQPVARLTSVAPQKLKRSFGMLKGKIPHLPDEFFFDPLPEEELRLWEGAMKILFDSHALVWYLRGDRRLSARVRELADDESVVAFVRFAPEKSQPRSRAASGRTPRILPGRSSKLRSQWSLRRCQLQSRMRGLPAFFRAATAIRSIACWRRKLRSRAFRWSVPIRSSASSAFRSFGEVWPRRRVSSALVPASSP
jgi:hypothetical protein